jgi:hypothetical protein
VDGHSGNVSDQDSHHTIPVAMIQYQGLSSAEGSLPPSAPQEAVFNLLLAWSTIFAGFLTDGRRPVSRMSMSARPAAWALLNTVHIEIMNGLSGRG